MINPTHLPPKTLNVSVIREWSESSAVEADRTDKEVRLGNAGSERLAHPNIVLLFQLARGKDRSPASDRHAAGTPLKFPAF